MTDMTPEPVEQDEVREVSPFQLDKNRRSTAPNQPAQNKTVNPDAARTLVPVKFTKPGEDIYASDDPDAAPIYSDFRPMIVPADSEVQVPGDEEDIPIVPKDLSALESASSSPPPEPTSTTPEPPATTVPDASLIQIAASSLDAAKDSGQPKENEPSTPPGSSTPTTSDGSSEPPA